MNKKPKNKASLIVFILFVFTYQFSKAQCNLGVYSILYGVPSGVISPTSGTTFYTHANYSPGTYFSFPMLNGGSYAVSTCGASIDTQITIWDPSQTFTTAFNDDNGPLCANIAASIDNYVPNFTNYAYVQVSQYNCLPGGSSSINVLIRQNNNLAFTSSGASMCSGQSRNLTATPANVGSSPGGYGNPGTFTGTGVSGSVFTAPVVSSPTNYTITYTFGYVSQTQVITVNPNPTVSVNSGTICSGNSFLISPSGGSTYTIQGGSPIVSPISNSSYTVVGTSAAGCLSSNTATSNVVVNISPTVSVNSGSICSGNSFTLLPSGANTYTIQGGASVVSPLTSSNYTVIGTASNGCISANTATSNLIVNTTPTVIVNSGAICSGGSFTITPSGASSYTIQGGSNIVSPSSNSTYTVLGTSSAGCLSSNTATSTITVNTIPTISVNSGAICSGNSFTITPSGASTYTIQGGANIVSPSSNSTYTVLGTSAAGCLSSNTATSNVTVNTTPTVNVSSGAICSGSSFTIAPSGASTYTISGGASVVSPTSNTNYSITGTSAQGCVSSNTAVSSVTVNALPTVSATSNSSLLCIGQSASLTANGATTYTWNTSANASAIVISPSVTTTYTVNGTDANGCSNAATITQSVSACTGLQSTISNQQLVINVYPNPSNGVYSIEVSTGSTSNISVVDLLGKVVYSQQLIDGKYIINLANLNNGLYILKAESNGIIKTVRLIKE